MLIDLVIFYCMMADEMVSLWRQTTNESGWPIHAIFSQAGYLPLRKVSFDKWCIA